MPNRIKTVREALNLPLRECCNMAFESETMDIYEKSEPLDPFYSAENQVRLQKSIVDYEAQRSTPITKSFAELDALIND